MKPEFSRQYYAAQGVFSCMVIEFRLYVLNGKITQYRNLLIYWLYFFLVFGAWFVDSHKILCDPGNRFISGHAIWHLLSAASLYYFYRY